MIYMEEQWVNLKFVGAPGYEVSNTGKVRNVKSGKQLNYSDNHGYYRVDLYIPELRIIGKKRMFKQFVVHRLVAMGFVSNQNNYSCVDHIDGNKHNNNASNLRWCTSVQNSNNPITRQRMIGSHSLNGRNGWNKGKHWIIENTTGKRVWFS